MIRFWTITSVIGSLILLASHRHLGQAAPSMEVTSPTKITKRLWKDLVCTCGKCNRITLEKCTCKTGTKEREVIATLVNEQRSTHPDKSEEAIYQTILTDYTARFGEKVLASYGRVPTWAMLLGAGTGVLLAFGALSLHRRRMFHSWVANSKRKR